MINQKSTISATVALALFAAVLVTPAMADHTPDAVDVPFVPLQTAYAEDFAEGDGGYSGTGSWQFGSPTGGPEIPEGKNSNVWGTNLAGTYGNNECSTLQSPAIDLSSSVASSAILSFKHYTDIEPRYDGAAVFVSADGVNWEYVIPNEGYDDTMFFGAYSCMGLTFQDAGYTGRVAEWRTSTFDVTDHLGGDLHVKWVFGSDFSVTDLGFYVDQVSVQLGAGGQSIELPHPSPEDLDPNEHLPERVNVPSVPLQTHYAEDFAEGDGGYSGTGSWEFGSPTGGPEIPEGKNSNVWGTNLAGTYGNNECSTLQSAPVDLSGALPGTTAQLSFKHYTDIENRWDGAAVFVSADGVNWEYVIPNEGYDDTMFFSAYSCMGLTFQDAGYTGQIEEWRTSTFDVSDYAGGNLHVKWVFGSDSSVTDLGFYVDQVSVASAIGGQNVAVPDLPGPSDLPLPQQVSLPSVPLQSAYAEDFAEGDGGYSGTGSWQFGSPTGGPEIPEGKNNNVWGTNLAGTYGNNECSTLQSAPVDLSGALPGTTAQLSFKHYTDIEPRYDGAAAFVSADGVNWEYVIPNEGYDDTMFFGAYSCMGLTFQDAGYTGRIEEWRTSTFDVSDYAGGDLHVKWVFGSDFSVTDLGFYVDQVTVQYSAGGQTIEVPELPDL